MLQKVEEFLLQQNISAYLVGGYVRDSLLKRATRDIDIAVVTNALPVARAMADNLGGAYVLLDEKQAIARVVVPDPHLPHERWTFDFSTIQENIEKDLQRRDFTIDAMAIRIGGRASEILDLFEGRSDLKRGYIRAVSETIFQDDPARLLRAVRLAAEYNFVIEEKTAALIRSQSHLLSRIAGERIREELCHLLDLPGTARHFDYLDQLGLLTVIFPELAQAKGVEQPKEHFWNVLDHSIQTVAAVERLLARKEEDKAGLLPPVSVSSLYFMPEIAQHFEARVGSMKRSSLMKLAALLHDIAKPQTKNIESDGRVHFFGHTTKGALMAKDILGRLRFSTHQSKAVQQMVEHHLRPWQMSNGAAEPTRRAIYRYFRDTGDSALDIIWLALADYLATTGPNLDTADWEKHVRMMSYVISQGLQEDRNIVSPPKLLNGHDLISLFGLKPGQQIGELLQAVEEAQGAGEIATRDEALALVQQRLSR